jgi:hypothetical protein
MKFAVNFLSIEPFLAQLYLAYMIEESVLASLR